MQMTSADKNRYFYEYAFWDLIRDYNEGQNIEEKRDYIMASEGRKLRERLGHNLASTGHELESTPTNRFVEAANAVLGERMGALPYDGQYAKAKINAQKRDYMSCIGLTEDGVAHDDAHFLPISPYDPRFANYDAVLSNGTRLGGVRMDAVLNSGPFMTKEGVTAATSQASVLDVFESCHDVPYTSNIGSRVVNDSIVWQGIDREQMLVSRADVTGMPLLKRFMSESDYAKCSAWVERNFNSEVTPRAVAILEELDKLGRSYTIEPDMNPGQLQVRVDNTRVSIRLVDTRENRRMVGRIYDNGAVMLLKTTRSPKIEDAPEPTIEENLMMLRYALGEPVAQSGTNKPVGKFETYERMERSKRRQVYGSYRNTRGSHVLIGKPHRDGNGKEGDFYNNQLYINIDTTRRSNSSTTFVTELDADEYLRDAVESARVNYLVEIDAERIIAHVAEHGFDEDFAYELSGNPDIAAIQESYYDVLLDKKATLMRPGHAAEEFEERLSEIGELETDEAGKAAMYRSEMSELVYPEDMSAEDMVREHVNALVDYQIGSYARDENGQRFNPVNVAAFQTSEYGIYRNRADVVKAMRMLNIEANELKGDDFYTNQMKSQLVRFDYESARVMGELESLFMQSMYAEIRDSLEANGVVFDENDIRIDKHGIVQYKGQIATAAYVDSKNAMQEVTGEIGQIFEPDEHNVVYTKFDGIENYAFVPGYEAHILAPMPGEPSTVEKRTRLRGYEQAMRENIRYQLRQDFLSVNGSGQYGAPTSVNGTYRHLYDERHDVDFVDKFLEQGMDEDVLWAIIETESQRVRYPNVVRDSSTIHAEYTAQTYNRDMANDNTGDAFVLTGGRNMSVLTEESDGYFDPIATTATSTNQGTLRYLVDGAKVESDGRIVPSEDKNARCAIMNHDLMRYMEFNPFDRQNMTLSNLMQASAVTRPVNVAQMTFGGWTMDDQVVITKRFAEEYKIRNRDGSLRPMTNGDKITDPYGNKGVVYVMDADMSDEEAEAQGILEQVQWLRANPELDVVMAPFPAVSRFNGGTARELMENPQSLTAPDGEVLEGAMGSMRFIVTDKSADAKTHVYEDNEGRKFSAQAAWAVNAKDAPAIMRECFGNNNGVLSNIREQLITCGLDISETGQLRVGYAPHEGEVRRVIEMPALQYRANKTLKSGLPSIDKKAMNQEFARLIAQSGGVLELPFELKYPTGEAIAPMNDGKTDVIYTKQEWERKGYTRKDGVYVRPTTVHRQVERGQRQTDNTTWGLPVMSSYLRSGMSFEDGTASTHDYTNWYVDVFSQANMYRACQEQLRRRDLSDETKELLQSTMQQCHNKAQASFSRITNDVVRRSFEGKHNVFRDNVMSHKMPNSATAIWGADPRLDIDQVAIGRAMADSIGVKDDDYILIWRDPILRDGGMRYLRAKVDDNLTGVAINPVMDKSFDGDFDGDTVAVVNLMSESARREAKEKFSVEANLLDYGVKGGDAAKPFELFMHQSLDVKVAFAGNESLSERFENIARSVNGFEADYAAGSVSRAELDENKCNTVAALSDLYRETFNGQCGKAVIRYDSPESHLQSIKEACIDTGAKGKPTALLSYMRWSGMEAPNAAEMDFSGAEMNAHTSATRADNQAVMTACAVKSFGTGIAGSYSQRGVAAMRNTCQKAVLELTMPVTQSLLQAKHNAEEAKHKYEMLMGPARDLWRGGHVVRNDDGRWVAEKDNGELAPCSKEEWAASFIEMYTSGDGLNTPINPDYVKQVANALSDENGMMLNLEEVDMAAPLDKLAYGGNFETLVEMSREGANLFYGKYTSQFAPRTIRQNAAICAEREADVESDKSVKAFVKSDVSEAGKDRAMGKKPKVSVGERRLPDNGVAVENNVCDEFGK